MCVYLSVLVCVFECLGGADDVGVWLFLRTRHGVTSVQKRLGGCCKWSKNDFHRRFRKFFPDHPCFNGEYKKLGNEITKEKRASKKDKYAKGYKSPGQYHIILISIYKNT